MLLTKSNCLLQILFLRKRHHHYYCCETASKSTAQKFWVFFWLLNNGFPGTQYHLHQRVNHQIFRKVALTLCRVLLKVSKKGLHSTSVTSRLWRKKANLFFKLLIFILFFFRESKLTRLLQDSLGGRTKTSIIATVSPGMNIKADNTY